jgi:hypothetical protein
MEIKPKIGFDNLKFGMTQKEVVEILGKPNKKIIDPKNEDHLILEWTSKLIRLVFYQHHNDRFAYFRTKNPNTNYNGQKIIERKVEFVKTEVFGDLVKKWEIEDYTAFETHFDEEYWINLDVEFGIVNGFELGVTFDEDEQYVWPI